MRGGSGEKGRKPAGIAHPGRGLLGYIPPQPSSEDPETPAVRAPDQQLWIQNNPRSSQLSEAQLRGSLSQISRGSCFTQRLACMLTWMCFCPDSQ